MKRVEKNTAAKSMIIFLIATLLLIICFCLFFSSRVSADSETSGYINSVESVLVKKGETLTSIAQKYAPDYSRVSAKEYTEHIRVLNNMDSEYIQAGHYILLPNYR